MLQFSVTHTNPRVFSVTHTNPRVFSVTEALCLLAVQSVTFGAASYAPGGSMSFLVLFNNEGGKGFDDITWEILDSADNIVNNGTAKSSYIQGSGSGSVLISGIEAPYEYSELRARAKGSADSEWNYSSAVYVLPVNLSVTATHPGSDIYWPDTTIDCHVHITNAGFAGSQTIEWQLIKTSDQSVLSSGSQSSGTIGDFTSAQVSLTGIVSPSGGDIMFAIRARIAGATEWVVTSMPMGNYLFYTIPPDPTPRG